MQRHGFRPQSDKSVWTGKSHLFSWERIGWKIDVVRLGWRVPPISTCFLDAQWSVPAAGGEPILASALNAIHARRGVNVVDLPKAWPLIGERLELWWRRELVADAERALAWCDRCATRAGALEDLARVTRNGPKVESDTYRAIERYVLERAPAG